MCLYVFICVYMCLYVFICEYINISTVVTVFNYNLTAYCHIYCLFYIQ